MAAIGLERVVELYRRGRTDSAVSFADWEMKAKLALPADSFGYVHGVAGTGRTAAANEAAYSRYQLHPRMLRNVESRDFSQTILGTDFPLPVALAPVGVQGILHPEGDLATSRAAASLGVPMVASTLSSFPLEAIAAAGGSAPRWFQLYPARHPLVMRNLIRRAEAAHYTALVVTVDTFTIGWRDTDLENAYLPFLSLQGMANYLTDDVFLSLLPAHPSTDPQSAVEMFLSVYAHPAFTWEDLAELKKTTALPILVKGILRADDALHAREIGLDGIVVSNHGGRQVDGEVASLDALARIRAAMGSDFPLLLDSGIRRGADALKALALGASAVLLGRPYLYGLAVSGEEGVREVLANFLAEFDLSAALCGCRTLADIDATLVSG